MSPFKMNPLQIGVAALLAIQLSLPLAAQDPPATRDVRAELKERMKTRYPVLEQLRDAGKIGETREGEVLVVKATDAGIRVDPKDAAKGTIGELVVAENGDRRSLYALLAKEMKLTPAEVGKQNGLRNLDKAKPDHWIEVNGKWVQRKSIRTIDQEKSEQSGKTDKS